MKWVVEKIRRESAAVLSRVVSMVLTPTLVLVNLPIKIIASKYAAKDSTVAIERPDRPQNCIWRCDGNSK